MSNCYVLIEKVSLPSAKALKHMALQFAKSHQPLWLVLGASIEQKPHLVVLCSEQLGWDAHELIQKLAQPIQGRGGGRSSFATARGSFLDGLSISLRKARDIAANLLVTAAHRS